MNLDGVNRKLVQTMQKQAKKMEDYEKIKQDFFDYFEQIRSTQMENQRLNEQRKLLEMLKKYIKTTKDAMDAMDELVPELNSYLEKLQAPTDKIENSLKVMSSGNHHVNPKFTNEIVKTLSIKKNAPVQSFPRTIDTLGKMGKPSTTLDIYL